jgi:hypothetical protein
MSVKVMGWVWELDIPSSEKLVLLAYADHAAHDGTEIYPAIALVARKTGYSQREVQRATRRLESRGLLIADGSGPHGTNKWRCPAPAGDNLPGVTPEGVTSTPPGDDNLSGATSTPAAGDGLSGVTSTPAGGEHLSGVTFAGVTSATAGGDIARGEGVTPMSPEPSLTVKEPSSRGGLSQAQQDQANAQVTAMIANGSKATYPNRDRIPEPYLSYADTYHDLTGQEPIPRVLRDWLATFAEWASEGIQPEHLRRAHKESLNRFMVLRPGSLTNMAAAFKAKERLRKDKPRDEVHQTRLLIEEMDRARARARPMPPETRERLDRVFGRRTVKREAQ